MEYLFLITIDEAMRPEPATAEPGSGTDEMAAWLAYNQKLMEGGHWISGASLHPSESTTVVHKADGAVTSTTDGPFAETKEQVGGYYTVRCADLDEALALAAEVPIPYGAIEVRPVLFRADA